MKHFLFYLPTTIKRFYFYHSGRYKDVFYFLTFFVKQQNVKLLICWVKDENE